MHDYKLRIEIDAEFIRYNSQAYIYDISFHDLPKVLQADYYIDTVKEILKRFKGYRRMTITISGFTSVNNQHNSNICEIRYLADSIDGVKRNQLRPNFNSYQDDDWHFAQLKDLPLDIKQCVMQINQLQLRQKQTA